MEGSDSLQDSLKTFKQPRRDDLYHLEKRSGPEGNHHRVPQSSLLNQLTRNARLRFFDKRVDPTNAQGLQFAIFAIRQDISEVGFETVGLHAEQNQLRRIGLDGTEGTADVEHEEIFVFLSDKVN